MTDSGTTRFHDDRQAAHDPRLVPLVFEEGRPGRRGFRFPNEDECGVADEMPAGLARRTPLPWPDMTERDVVRHFTRLSQLNYCLDTHFYPLGSCTMKYNPRLNEAVAGLPGFRDLHPLVAQLPGGEDCVQGALQVLAELERWLCALTGMKAFTLHPLAGAQGELTGVMMMAAYHRRQGHRKTHILVPDSAHGTNPATAAMVGYDIVSIPTDRSGCMDWSVFRQKLNPETAGLMITCPNTLGLYNERIKEIADAVHGVDGLMYYDGANLNALLGRCRPGDLGFDCVHINTHKTLSTPHGCGGPGAGPVGVNDKLVDFLPISRVVRRNGGWRLCYEFPDSVGYVSAYYGHFGVLLRALAYLLVLGAEGLRETADMAVLNANYLLTRLRDRYHASYGGRCLHEFVISAVQQARRGVHAHDIAKYLIDEGFHPPTVYFPLIVKEALMVEPTETESLQTLDAFVEAMIRADELSRSDPAAFAAMPEHTVVTRPDEVTAARRLRINHCAL